MCEYGCVPACARVLCVVCACVIWVYAFAFVPVLGLGRTNSPTSARRGNGLGLIGIWATPPIRLVFWDGAPTPSFGIRAMPRN